MHKLLECCSQLGIPIAQDKTEDFTTCLTFLGIEIDTQAMELRLPAEKLARVRQTVSEWLGRKAARRRELESLVGILQHASKVVIMRPGRRFVRRLIQVMSSVKGRDHFVRLGVDVRSDLMWWQLFLETWNGIGILPNSKMGHIDLFTRLANGDVQEYGMQCGSIGNGVKRPESGTLLQRSSFQWC